MWQGQSVWVAKGGTAVISTASSLSVRGTGPVDRPNPESKQTNTQQVTTTLPVVRDYHYHWIYTFSRCLCERERERVCVCVWACVCECVCAYGSMNMCLWVYECRCGCINLFQNTSKHVYVHVYECLCVYMWVFIYIESTTADLSVFVSIVVLYSTVQRF